jgi:ornithine racemase
MNYPCLKIDLNKISKNCRIISDRCARSGISVVGVSKCVLGDIRIAQVFKKSGISIIGDSRLKNLKKLRDFFGPGQKLILLRTPMISEIDEMVKICDISMNTQIETVKVISEACRKYNLRHSIMIMVEIDDRREGILPGDVITFCSEVTGNCRSVDIWGIGTNARCISKRKPKIKSIELLVGLRELIKEKLNISIPVISGGNSSVLDLIFDSTIPKGVNQLRIGEAILLGHETANYNPISGAYTDAFTLDAEIIEVKKRGGKVYKIILALGIQDVNYKNICFINPNLDIINQSSDHTVISVAEGSEIAESGEEIKVGDKVSFGLDYFGLLSCMTSPFVEKKYIEG